MHTILSDTTFHMNSNYHVGYKVLFLLEIKKKKISWCACHEILYFH